MRKETSTFSGHRLSSKTYSSAATNIPYIDPGKYTNTYTIVFDVCVCVCECVCVCVCIYLVTLVINIAIFHTGMCIRHVQEIPKSKRHIKSPSISTNSQIGQRRGCLIPTTNIYMYTKYTCICARKGYLVNDSRKCMRGRPVE